MFHWNRSCSYDEQHKRRFPHDSPSRLKLAAGKARMAGSGEIQNAIFKPSLPLTVELS